jgi:hypothetical protein
MARAEAIIPGPVEQELENAGDAMMMLISRSVWEVLKRQAVAENVEPGTILSKAISEYVSAHGSDDVKKYILSLEPRRDRA